ncbi:hypothetical protein EDB86DRAFT_3085127 [Lactarius hatsudake]|nr:hypothetical protein EDB86DRAFT_3085127 [Lactarius hatsudake]
MHLFPKSLSRKKAPPQNVNCNDTVAPKQARYTDSSNATFSVYVTHAQKLDGDNVENRIGVAERIIFVRSHLEGFRFLTFLIGWPLLIHGRHFHFRQLPELAQDPNIITQSLLAQISQQFSDETFNDAGGVPNTSVLSSIITAGSVAFINSVRFLSLAVNFMANQALHFRAHIRKYFAEARASSTSSGSLRRCLSFSYPCTCSSLAFNFCANRTSHISPSQSSDSAPSFIALTLLPLIFRYHCPFWSSIIPGRIIRLAQRAFTSKLPISIQQRRTRACLKALYYVPGADRDLLTPPCSDSARQQNIARFLADIKHTPRDMNTQWWASNNAELIHKERLKLAKARRDHTEEYRHGKFDQQPEGDRELPASPCLPHHNLVTCTLEILAQDPVIGAAVSQRRKSSSKRHSHR